MHRTSLAQFHTWVACRVPYDWSSTVSNKTQSDVFRQKSLTTSTHCATQSAHLFSSFSMWYASLIFLCPGTNLGKTVAKSRLAPFGTLESACACSVTTSHALFGPQWRSHFHTRARYVFKRSTHGAHQGGGYKVDIPLDPVLARKKLAGVCPCLNARSSLGSAESRRLAIDW